jgi:diguanylate cyclase (GGDEF)-like protein
MLMADQEADIHILPEADRDPKLQHSMMSVLAGGKDTAAVIPGIESTVSDLRTTNRLYGYAALYRHESFDEEERSIFSRFCSHIALTLEKISLFEEIRILSRHDGLTGAYNHACIVGELAAEIERSKRYSTPFSVILFDVDDFKTVNDRYGHLVGDQVLKGITRIVKENLRAIDKVGRYGGEEFLVILPETSADKAILVAERLRIAVEKAVIESDNNIIRSTVSGGVVAYASGCQEKDLIKKADDNLYRAKKDGKNRTYYEDF